MWSAGQHPRNGAGDAQPTEPIEGDWGLANSGFADRLRGMAFVIDRVELLGYVASDACLRDDATGTLSVPLGPAAGKSWS